MSNIVKIDVEIRDEAALISAAERIGLVKVEKTHYRCYYQDSDKNRCDYVLAVAGAQSNVYEVGVTKTKDGEKFLLAFDTHAGGHGLLAVTQNKGHGPMSRLQQHYAVEVAAKELRRSGYRVQERTNEQGELVLVAV